MARQSAPPSVRAAGYRAVARATLQLGPAATPYLATPALPALLAEVRAIVTASGAAAGNATAGFEVVSSSGNGTTLGTVALGTRGGAAGYARGQGRIRVEPAMSARKSSQKKQRKSREKEVGRALAAATAAAEAAAAGSGVGSSSGTGRVGGGAAVGGGGGSVEEAQREAVCEGLSCVTQIILTCNARLPLPGRLAVEDVLHVGLGVLSRTNVRRAGGGGGGGRNGIGGGVCVGNGCLPLEDVRVVREFISLAHACLVTPLVSQSRIVAVFVAVCCVELWIRSFLLFSSGR